MYEEMKAAITAMQECLVKMEAALAEMEPEAMARRDMEKGFAQGIDRQAAERVRELLLPEGSW
jgi:predicted hydrolase (HD superfamily)